MAIGFLVISFIFDLTLIPYFVAGVGVAVIMFPVLGKWLEKGWLKLAMALGWVNARILLSIVFFLFLTPLALLFRLFTKNPLQLKKEEVDSYYTVRNHTYGKEDLKNMW